MGTTIKVTPASAATHFRGIKIAATATPGTTLHVAQAAATDGCVDVVEVRVYNSDTVDRLVTFECGGTTAPDDNQGGYVGAKETRTFTIFMRNGLTLKAFADTANVLVAHINVQNAVYA
jgi:hypothetical protein